MSTYDTKALYEFISGTPEQGLRKMLVDGKPMTDVHFQLLLKVVRSVDEVTFSSHFEKTDFPKIKMGPAEQKIRDKFWGDCVQTFKARGLLSPASAPKAA
jgi:hypothetical protein